MPPTLEQYLVSRSFVAVPSNVPQQRALSVRTYENGEFRVHIVDERGEVYVQVAPVAQPEERRFLSGLVAFLTGDDSATRQVNRHTDWLMEHHSALARFFAGTPEGQTQRERYASWEQGFAKREQARLAAMVATALAKGAESKRWWKLW